MFFSLVARAATLGNSWNLHKSKMATMDSGFAPFDWLIDPDASLNPDDTYDWLIDPGHSLKY